MSCCFFDHVSSNINNLRLALCILRVPFHQPASPRDFTSHTSRTGTLYIYKVYIYLYIYILFFTLRHFFLFRPRGFPRDLGSVAHTEPARTPYASLGSGRGLWHVLWGFKVARPLGEAFRARRAIQAHANPRTYYIINRLKKVRRLMRCLGS